MFYYFEPTNEKGFRGRPRCTIVTTLDNDIKRTANKKESFQLSKLTSLEDLKYARTLAQDRQLWRKIINEICEVAEAEKPH